jgi:hypothetical protein
MQSVIMLNVTYKPSMLSDVASFIVLVRLVNQSIARLRLVCRTKDSAICITIIVIN